VVDAAGGTSARLLRGATGEQIILVELDEVPEALDPAELPRPDVDDAAWGLYRLDFVALSDPAAPAGTGRPGS
jgi:hypothetical protein